LGNILKRILVHFKIYLSFYKGVHLVKILVISPTSSGIGGVAQHVSKLVRKLMEKGFYVDVLSCNKVGCLKRKGFANLSFVLISTAYSLLRDRSYDIVHAHNIPATLAMKVVKGKKVLTFHGVFSDQISFLYGTYLGVTARLVEWAVLRWANAITAVSLDVTKKYRSIGYNVHYIPNAIDLRDLPKEAIRLYDKQVIYVGRLSQEKGLVDLVRAFTISGVNAHLLIIGDGPLRDFLKSVALRNPRIHILGYKPRIEALKLVKGSDLFILPSYHEGLSTALLEAMALQIPCIATAVGGNVELLEDGAGLLVRPGNVWELANKIQLILNDKNISKNVTQKAYEKVLKRYTWDKVLPQYVSLYTDLLKEG